jgi:hypothetical protein
VSPALQVRIGAAVALAGLAALVIGVVGLVRGGDGEVAGAAASMPASTAPARATASSGAAAGSSPSATPPAPPSPAPAMTMVDPPSLEIGPSSPSPAPAGETVEDFVAVFNAAFDAGDATTLFERLHPIVLDVFDAGMCRSYLDDIVSTTPPAITVREVGAPADWDWEVDGQVVTVANAIPVEVERDVGSQTVIQEVHYARSGDELRWFTDCTP